MGRFAAHRQHGAGLLLLLLAAAALCGGRAGAEEPPDGAQLGEAALPAHAHHRHAGAGERRHARVVHRGRDAGGESAKHRRAPRPPFHATAADAQAAAQWADRSKYGGTLVNRGDSLADLPGLRPPVRRPDPALGNATDAGGGEAVPLLKGKGSIKARMHEVDSPPDARCMVRAAAPRWPPPPPGAGRGWAGRCLSSAEARQTVTGRALTNGVLRHGARQRACIGACRDRSTRELLHLSVQASTHARALASGHAGIGPRQSVQAPARAGDHEAAAGVRGAVRGVPRRGAGQVALARAAHCARRRRPVGVQQRQRAHQGARACPAGSMSAGSPRAHALRCCCRACGVAARCRTGRKARCRSERAARSGWSRAVPAAQVPWTLTIVMPPNEKFVTVFNARLTDTSADGVSTMSVSDEWQTLQANRVNAADVSFLVDASSQVRTCVAAGWRRQWGSRTGRNARCMWACCEACCAVWGCP